MAYTELFIITLFIIAKKKKNKIISTDKGPEE